MFSNFTGHVGNINFPEKCRIWAYGIIKLFTVKKGRKFKAVKESVANNYFIVNVTAY